MTRCLCLVFACGVIGFTRCSPPDTMPAEAKGPLPSSEGYVQTPDGVQLFYRLLGSGLDTIVVLHGGPGFTMEYLYADLEPLAAGHTLLFYDQRGTGRSTLVTDSTALDGESFVADLESIRRHFGMEKVVLLGHSWGAGLAALYAQHHPERVARMVIVGALPLRRSVLLEGFQALDASRDSVTRRRMAEWREARLANPGDAAACREYYVLWFRPFVADTSSLSRSKGDFCAGTEESLRNKMTSVDRYTMASLGDWDWRSSMQDVASPALVIHGTADPLPLDGAREWARVMPNARIVEMEGVGHFPYLETPQAFVAAVDQFLRGKWPVTARTVP